MPFSDASQWKQIAAQHSSSAPVLPWRESHLDCLRRTARGAGPQHLDRDGKLRLLASSTQRQHDAPPKSRGVTHPFVLGHDLCKARQLVVVRPVHPAELGYGIARLQAR